MRWVRWLKADGYGETMIHAVQIPGDYTVCMRKIGSPSRMVKVTEGPVCMVCAKLCRMWKRQADAGE